MCNTKSVLLNFHEMMLADLNEKFSCFVNVKIGGWIRVQVGEVITKFTSRGHSRP